MKKEDKTLLIITHILGIVSYLFGPLLVYILTNEKEVKKHARNALNWQISLGIYYVFFLTISSLSVLLMNINPRIFIIFPFGLILSLLTLLNIIFCVIAAFKASEGLLWNYPLSINIIGKIGEKDINKNINKGKKELKKAYKEVKKEFKKK